MKKITWVLLLILLIVLALTNPNESDFQDYLSNKIEKESSSGSGLANAIRGALSGPIAELIGSATERQNYLLFSVYNLEVANMKNMYIGVAGHFIPIKDELSTKNSLVP